MPITYPYTQYGGIWKLNAASAAQGAGTWPVPPLAYDPYFYDVSLLLTGDGTNGAQNNTFLDSSTNNFTITRNGNATQGTFSPYGSLWSNYFNNATPDYLSFASNSIFSFGTGDFTVEAWVFKTIPTSSISCITAIGGSFGLIFYPVSSKLSIVNAVGTEVLGDPDAFPMNQWVHIAATRSSGTLRLFVNGVLKNSVTDSTNYSNTSTSYVGLWLDSTNFQWGGNISNLRYVKGTALYTASFTPSTEPLTAVAGTSLLTCQSNRFIDNSGNNVTLTTTGTPSVQRFSPFNPTAPYSAATIGGSGYFDGAGDYLTATSSSLVPSTTSTPLTLEAWVYPTTSSGNYIISSEFNGSAVGYTLMLGDTPDSTATTNVIFACYGGGFGWRYVKSTQQIKLNTWTHIAGVFTGSTSNIFINGVLTDSGGAASWLTTGSSTVRIGYRWDEYNAPYYFTGYISDARITIGTAVYSSTFTPPTAPLAPVTNTQLLTNFTNAGIPDAAMINDLETVGNAQVSTTQAKFGGSSMYFDGSGDYLVTPYSPQSDLGSGDFTIEGWIYPVAEGGKYFIAVNSNSSYAQVAMAVYGTAKIEVDISTSNGAWAIVYSSPNNSITLNTWNHVALVRNGSSFVLYLNGTGYSVGTNSSSLYNYGGQTYIGYLGSSSYYFNGYVDDLRITKGVARYTTNFTPPTSAFQTY